MSTTRRDVLEALGARTDADAGRTTTVDELATALGADDRTVERHLRGLEACELARTVSDGDVRVTTTGEELLELAVEGPVIVDIEYGDRAE